MTLRDAPANAAADARTGAAGVREASTPDRIAAAVVREILQRRLKPGERVTEAELTQRMGVGRSTVREAFRILCASGAIELTRHRGAVIRMLDEADCRELLEVVEVLLGLAARLAARHIGIGDNRIKVEAVARKLHQLDTAREPSRVLQERLDFYGVMLGMAGSDELDRALPLARAQIFRTQVHEYLSAADFRAMIVEYAAVADAILAGDQRSAEQRMRRHVQRTAQRMIPRLSRSTRRQAAAS